jgi:hypothetical protein
LDFGEMNRGFAREMEEGVNYPLMPKYGINDDPENALPHSI